MEFAVAGKGVQQMNSRWTTDLPRKSLDFALRIATSLFLAFALAGLASAIVLFFVGKTLDSKLFALGTASALVLVAYFLLCLRWWTLPKRRRLVAGLFITSLVFFALCSARSPYGKTNADSAFQSVGSSHSMLARFSPAMLVPEGDQLRLGSYLLPLVDRYMDFPQAARFRAIFDSVYSEMQTSHAYPQLKPVLGDAYWDLLFRKPSLEHWYIYYPKARKEKSPVLVFFHGALGNFTSYIWIWSSFAEKNGFVVVCPSFGAGFWDRPAGEEMIKKTLALCRNDPRIDANQIYLAGISNGAMGVTRAALLCQEPVRGLVYISPVLEGGIILSSEFRERVAKTPILVVHGALDNRTRQSWVAKQVDIMLERGLNVQRRCYESEEHLLLFASFGQLGQDIEIWMQAASHPDSATREDPAIRLINEAGICE